MDRRKNFSTYNGSERRSGVDRRRLEEKLKHLIEKNAKDQQMEKQKSNQPGSGNVILRRKGKKNKPPSV